MISEFSAELFVTVSAIVLLLLSSFLKSKPFLIKSLIALIAIILLSLSIAHPFQLGVSVDYFDNLLIRDNLSALAFMIIAVCTVIASFIFMLDKKILFNHLEFGVLFLFVVLSALLLASTTNLLVAYICIEMLSLSLYALIAITRKDVWSLEAAMKYFILGAVASGFLVMGVSYLFGVSGSLDINHFYQGYAQSAIAHKELLLLLALVFILTALFFKLGLAPLHGWLPDVYQGANYTSLALVATLPKIAVVFLLLRLMKGFMMLSVMPQFASILLIVSVLSVIVGAVSAVNQNKINKVLAFSSILNFGFIATVFYLMALYPTQIGEQLNIMLFYLFVYVVSLMLVFLLLAQMEKKDSRIVDIKDLVGLGQKNTLAAFALLCAFVSFAGIPPFIGFFSKLTVFSALIKVKAYGLLLILILMSVVACFYYLKVVKVKFFESSDQDASISVIDPYSSSVSIIAGLLLLILLLFSIKADLIYSTVGYFLY
jgi:NADH-quinone oxidoreductase subunit N